VTWRGAQSRLIHDRRPVVRAGLVSFTVGSAIMLAKFVAWAATDSAAIFADAAESIVNVVAAAVATYSVAVAARPADAEHPYGHGKAEPLSAAVEGSLIVVAAAAIIVSAVHDIIVGPELRRLGFGIALSGAAGLANLGLALYLVRVGRQSGSEAIEADGMHVMTDVFTTAGALVALGLVKLTGFVLLDPIAALLVAANILWTGSKVIRRALAALLDEADFAALERLAARLREVRRSEWVEIHQLRYRTSGPFAHLDLHLIVPRYLSIEDAHRIGDELEAELLSFAEGTAEAVVHLDPCTPRHCRACAVEGCPVRSTPLEKPFPFDVESLTKRGII
jgi:cation diffusion facilitator family transporter